MFTSLRVGVRFYSNSAVTKKVAVILSGCGVFDGSEVHESVSVLLSLSQQSAEYHCFAPDRAQSDTVNHYLGIPSDEERNCLTEAARIARGNIKPLNAINVNDFHAVIFPGGFGAAKNLCNYATQGADFTVSKDVINIISDFHKSQKPIGLCCISPLIAAKAIPGCKVTLGDDPNVAGAVQKAGSEHVNASVTEVCVDETNKIVTTPAYMYGNASIAQVYQGISNMVAAVLKLTK